MIEEKRPRQYAAEIQVLPSKEARREALALVPELYREWVEWYVRIYFMRKAGERASVDAVRGVR